MRFEKRLSPDEIKTWCAEQAPHLSKEDISELVDWMGLAFRAPPEIKKTLQDTLIKGDGTAMKNVFELVANDWRKEGLRDGERKKALEIAAGMKAEGMDVYAISRLTGLTVDEILQR